MTADIGKLKALAPCPFCESHAQTDFIEGESYIIECYACEASTGCKDSAEAAIGAWNRRSAPAGVTNKDAEMADVRHCWSCKRPYWSKQAIDSDGSCPHCGVEIDAAIAAQTNRESTK